MSISLVLRGWRIMAVALLLVMIPLTVLARPRVSEGDPEVRKAGAGQKVTFGFTDYPDRLSAEKGDSAAGYLFARLVARGLTREKSILTTGGPRFDLELAESLQVSADLRRWEFGLRTGAIFSDGSSVLPEDVQFSLGRCVVGKEIEGIELLPHGVALTLRPEVLANPDLVKSFPERLASCPVWERRTGLLFGERLGEGTLLVGAGMYAPIRAEPSRRLILTLVGSEGGSETVEFRSSPTGDAALQLLRGGTLDLLATEDPSTLEKAAKDETLLLGKCSIYSVIARRGLRFGCEQPLVASPVREHQLPRGRDSRGARGLVVGYE